MWRATKQGLKWYAVEFKLDYRGDIPEEEMDNIKELTEGGDVVILANDLETIQAVFEETDVELEVVADE